jgi:hypothetical protein
MDRTLVESFMTSSLRSVITRIVLSALLLLLSFPLSSPLFAQQSLPQLTRIEQDQANIVLDGFVDEAVWQDRHLGRTSL